MARAIAVLLILAVSGAATAAPAGFTTRYLYHLSTSTGAVATSWASITYDTTAGEVFVIDTGTPAIRIFGGSGMETFRVPFDDTLGTVLSTAPLPDGDLIAIAVSQGRHAIVRCNFRGEPRQKLHLEGLPEAFARAFTPTVIIAHRGQLYFGDLSSARVVVTDPKGRYLRSYDLRALLKLKPRDARDLDLADLGVDPAGNLVFSCQSLFTVFVVAPDGKVRAFGGPGNLPGTFNVVGGVAADEDLNYFATDVLRGTVQVFDRSLALVGEIDVGPAGVVAPRFVAAGRGKVFVSSSARRGIAVFRIDRPAPPARSAGTRKSNEQP